jgi:hypothetical protein
VGPQAFFLFSELRRHLSAEIFHLEDLPNLDLRILVMRVGAALDPLDRFFLRLHPPDPKTANQLLGLGKPPVDDGTFLILINF